MKTNGQIKSWILENCVDSHGDINITGLDFSDFNGNVWRHKWKIKGNLIDGSNEVEGDLWQDQNKVKGKTYQDFEHHNKVLKWDVEKRAWVEDERFTKEIRESENK